MLTLAGAAPGTAWPPGGMVLPPPAGAPALAPATAAGLAGAPLPPAGRWPGAAGLCPIGEIGTFTLCPGPCGCAGGCACGLRLGSGAPDGAGDGGVIRDIIRLLSV